MNRSPNERKHRLPTTFPLLIGIWACFGHAGATDEVNGSNRRGVLSR